VLLAALDDIIESKQFAGRDKDREGLPELLELQRADAPALLLRPIIGAGSRRPRRPAIARGRVAPITLRQLNSTDGGQRSDGGSCSVVGRAGIRVPS
jgi:hypothetical protein